MARKPKIPWRKGKAYCASLGQCEIEVRSLEDETGAAKVSWAIITYENAGIDWVRTGEAADVRSAKKAALAAFKTLPARLREDFPDLSPKERRIARARAMVEAFDNGEPLRPRIEWLPEKSVVARVGEFELYASDYECDLPAGRHIYWQLLQGEEDREVAKGDAPSLKEAQQAVLAAFMALPESRTAVT
jgi:hypothetical protein